MVTDDLIYKSTSLREVKNLLQTSSNTLSELCQNPNINKWAKYKPVPLMKSVKDDNIINNGRDWEGLPQTGTNCTGQAWWLGGIIPTYTIPTLSSLSDIASNGQQNNAMEWVYNKPSGSIYEPFRLSDFIGYYHAEGFSPIICNLRTSLEVNGYFTASIYGQDAEDMVNNYTGDDIAGLVYCDVLYAGITIVNRTRGTQASGVSEEPIGKDNSSSFFLSVNSCSIIANVGMGISIQPYDVVDVYLYMTPDKDANFIYGDGRKFSALVDQNSVVYRRYIAGVKQTYTDVPFKVNNFSCRWSGSSKQYIRYDDNIYISERSIQYLTGIFKAEPTGNSRYSNLRINITSQCQITVGEDTYTVDGVIDRKSVV